MKALLRAGERRIGVERVMYRMTQGKWRDEKLWREMKVLLTAVHTSFSNNFASLPHSANPALTFFRRHSSGVFLHLRGFYTEYLR